ncbi:MULTISPECIES: L-rhamnose mutarotase [Chitinophagaceae]
MQLQKKISSLLFAAIFLWMPFIVAAQVSIWVAPSGNDNGNGSREMPFASLRMALRKARDYRRMDDSAIKNGIHIMLDSGTYFLDEPIVVHSEDSGTPDAPLVIEGATNAQSILSGGVIVNDWKPTDGNALGLHKEIQSQVMVADLSNINTNLLDFRQIWVNGRKAVRAKSSTGKTMHRILGWDKTMATAIVPIETCAHLDWSHGLEFFIHQWWETANLRVRKLEKLGDSCRVYFYEPESHIENEHPWPAPWLSTEIGNSAFFFVNSLQLLDEPGEWFYDVSNKKLYYYPLAGEDMRTAKVIVPLLENLLSIQGTPEHPVRNIKIKNISFQNTTWMRPSLQGHVPHQAGLYMTEAYKLKPIGTKDKPTLDNQAWVGRPAAAVNLSYTANVVFERNTFQHLSALGLDVKEGTKYISIIGNLFKDIGSTAIMGGYYGEHGLEIHRPFNTTFSNSICENILVQNNLVTDAANEDWGAVGIGFGYASNITIKNNELENLPYSAISMGWGWTPVHNVMERNLIVNNKVHHYGRTNYDCAGIYTLSAQPGTIIEDNYIDSIFKAPYAHLPTHWFYLYTDEGSSGITIKNNWTPSEKFLQNNNGPDNQWLNNGPQVSDTVKHNAGLAFGYYNLLQYKTSSHVHQAINKERKEVVELLLKDEKRISFKELCQLLNEKKVKDYNIYRWKNHIVIYGYIQDVSVLRGLLQKRLNAVVKVYQDQIYDFERKERCDDCSVADKWSHVVMTADLVANPKMQQAYIDAHNTQYEKWPEVAKGFCNASFQQLQVFKNERQLMLIISIPEGKKLKDLNPKTTENNTKVNEWNTLMCQYQQGIPGTIKGEIWVELKQVNE